MLLQIICNLNVICFLHLVLLFSGHCKLIQTSFFQQKQIVYLEGNCTLVCLWIVSLWKVVCHQRLYTGNHYTNLYTKKFQLC